MRELLLIAFSLLVSLSFGQANKRETTEYWGSANGEVFLKDSSLVFFDNNYRISDNPDIGFYRYHVFGGFEYALSTNWRAAMGLKYADFIDRHDVYINPYLQHVGHIGSLRFTKELAFDWIAKSKSDNPNLVIKDEARWSLRARLEKDWWFNDHLFRVGAFYRMFIISRVGEDKELFNSYPRTIDKTRMQWYVQYEVLKRVFVKGYFMRETDYFFNINDETLNIVKNIAGIELKYVLY